MSLLEIKKLKATFYINGSSFDAVRDVSLTIEKGDIIGIVGESGSGKSMTMKSVIGLIPQNCKIEEGEILFQDQNIKDISEEEKRKFRGKEIAMIFQDPMTALNPLKTIGFHIKEILSRHKNIPRNQLNKEVIEILKLVGITSPEKRLKQYPHEFSGGMRQRVMIAMALSCDPKLLIADEPTTALDVTIQSQILELLKQLKEKRDMSIALITHDLGIVAKLCNKIVVMYGGMVMEEGLTDEIFYNSKHPYTKALLKSVPKLNMDSSERLTPIKGTTPTTYDTMVGCPFASRCEFAKEQCFANTPEIIDISLTQKSRCFFAMEVSIC